MIKYYVLLLVVACAAPPAIDSTSPLTWPGGAPFSMGWDGPTSSFHTVVLSVERCSYSGDGGESFHLQNTADQPQSWRIMAPLEDGLCPGVLWTVARMCRWRTADGFPLLGDVAPYRKPFVFACDRSFDPPAYVLDEPGPPWSLALR